MWRHTKRPKAESRAGTLKKKKKNSLTPTETNKQKIPEEFETSGVPKVTIATTKPKPSSIPKVINYTHTIA